MMPYSKELDHSKLCNYIGFLENDKAESVVAVTGCLSRQTPDEKMMITMFSKHSETAKNRILVNFCVDIGLAEPCAVSER